jgi:urease accessory protein
MPRPSALCTDLLIWQLADSAFPTGSFAHSFGLEAAWHQGGVDGGSVAAFVRDGVTQAGRGGLPFVTSAHAHPGEIEAFDERCDAFLRSPVANRASRIQGRAWLATVERSFPRPAVYALCETARTRLTARHYAVVFGAVLCAVGLDAPTAQRLFLFGVCRGVASAAVRLGLVGTTEAQRIISETAEEIERTRSRCSALTIEEAAQTAPLIDLWQSSHDRLYSRLFQS